MSPIVSIASVTDNANLLLFRLIGVDNVKCTKLKKQIKKAPRQGELTGAARKGAKGGNNISPFGVKASERSKKMSVKIAKTKVKGTERPVPPALVEFAREKIINRILKEGK